MAAGCGAAWWLAAHPLAWPHRLIAEGLVRTGQIGFARIALFRAAVGGLLAALLTTYPGVVLNEKQRAARRRNAVRRAAKESEEADAERARMSGATAKVDTQAIIGSAMATGPNQPSNRATPGFVVSLLAGAIAIVCAVEFYLTHF